VERGLQRARGKEAGATVSVHSAMLFAKCLRLERRAAIRVITGKLGFAIETYKQQEGM